ncbi:MAG: hypothetical protein HYY52_00615 [Candidatus Melainabacteria bacterium]|nr:hypothetical protein [Candidatus Melainabacteria bacterium]
MRFLSFKQKIKKLPLFSTSLINTLTENPFTLKVQLTKWKKDGLITQLRKGLYVLGKKEREIEPSLFYLANQIFIPSYVSLESALAYYNLIPEYVHEVTSVTTRKTCKFKNEFGIFTYQHLKPNTYTGFNLIEELNKLKSLIALPEKAVVDFLYLNLSRFSKDNKDIFVESYRFQNCEKLNKRKIRFYAKMFNSKKLALICNLFIEELIK